MILAAALALGMQAQVKQAGDSVILPPSTTVLQPDLIWHPDPGPFPNGPFPCYTGLKLQRYHEHVNLQADIAWPQTDNSGWYDVTPGPHEGDYRCVKADEKAASPVANPIPSENMEFSAQTIPGGPGIEFPSNHHEGQLYVTPGRDSFYFLQGHWRFALRPSWHPADTGMNACPSGSHLHPRQMSTFMPDTKGGPIPKADGLCHRDDDTDAPVLPHGRKLEAAK